jgi:hypothetical protein
MDLYTGINRTNGYAAFPHILCNSSSILSTFSSNHSLERLCSICNERTLPEDLRSLLRINKDNSNSQAARTKIIRTHFRGISINTQIFSDVELHVLPTAISWMGRDDGSDVLFAFIRSMPQLCETKSKRKQRKMEG